MIKKDKLANLVKFLSGFAFKAELFDEVGLGKPIIRIRDIVRGFTKTYYKGDFTSEYVVHNGDYLIGMDGEFNIARWQGGEALLNQRVCKIQTVDESLLDKDYLACFLAIELKKIEALTPYVTVKHLSIKTLNDIQIPLPPLEEQKRIAHILDLAAGLQAKRRQTLARLDALLQSTFLEMFGDPVTNPKGWEVKELEKVCINVIDCPHSTPTWLNSGVICLRTSNLGKGEWIWNDIRYISNEEYLERIKRALLNEGDIILSREGTVGVLAIVEKDMKLCMGQRLVQLKPDLSAVTSEYLLWLLLHELDPQRIEFAMMGSTSKHLNVRDLKKLRIVIPPIHIQNNFTLFFNQIKKQKIKYQRSLTQLDTLFASLQQRAFSGRL